MSMNELDRKNTGVFTYQELIRTPSRGKSDVKERKEGRVGDKSGSYY